jgi:pimeloyl-ACP methyl ester carboxylesterase
VRSAIEVYDWTTRLPGTMVLNLTDYQRNERKAREIADRIRRYQRAHPGRPVHLVGHSGGGGIAVLTMEALKQDEEIEMALLLGPALSREYDLTRALKHALNGIVNFYSESDVALLRVGTVVAGTIDREHGASAGALGFLAPRGLSADGRRLYKDRLRQVGWSERLERYGASGTHMGWTSSTFAKRYLAEAIKRNEKAALQRLTEPAQTAEAETPFEPADEASAGEPDDSGSAKDD